jgi:UDP-N-acetylmuramate dehydrogenase
VSEPTATPASAPPALRFTERDREALAAAVGLSGEARFDEPLARHTTLRIGGPVDAWLAPGDVAAVQKVRSLCAMHNWPCRAVGAGSNLLVRDGGVRGVVLTTERLRALSFEGPRAVVGAGVATGKLLAEATRRDLGGVEFLGGVPGSVGGGLIMNAGTYLGEFKDVTRHVRTVDARGSLVEREAVACGFVYRGSALPPDEVVVEGDLELRPRPRAEIERDVRALRERRRAREPHGLPNAGSIFKNPPGDFAGRLIEACGLKGRRVGGAEISPAHANGIVNAGGARAADVLALIEVARAAVQQHFGVELALEVKVIGEP